MPKQVNGPQNKEQLKLMVDVVKREVDLAQDLLNSYQEDLEQLESNSAISDKEKESKRVFLETAIKESEELLKIRQKQLKAIDPMKSGKKVGEARRAVWSDTTLESRGMNAIISEMAASNNQLKHNEEVEKTRKERQERSEAVKNAAATLATAPRKLAEENYRKPEFIEGSDKWTLTDISSTGNVLKFIAPDSSEYYYFPKTEEVRKSEKVGNKRLNTYYDINTKSWNQIPEEVMNNGKMHFNSYMGQWMQYDFEKGKWQENNWLLPTYKADGRILLDENGKMVLVPVSEEEYEDFINNGGRSDAEKAKLARQIKDSVLEQEDKEEILTPEDIGRMALEDQKDEFGKRGPRSSDVILRNPNEQKQIHLNWFQKLKLWFMRLFNKNYQLPEVKSSEFYLSDDIKQYKEDAIKESKKLEELKEQEKEAKRTIKGFSKPKVKQFFKDHKNKLLSLGALALASVALFVGINGIKEHDRQIIEQKAAEAQKEADLEAQKQQEEQQAIEEALEDKQSETENTQDTLVFHDENTLTTGSFEKQYFANAGLEYTADSTGRGTRGTLGQDTVVEIFNRAIVRENEDGTKEILLTSNGKTWEECAKDTGKSIDEISNMLKDNNTYEMVAMQVGGTNHNIFNTYGWIKAKDLKESSRGTENLKNYEIVFEDNTEILQQLQEKESANQISQDSQEER